MMDKFQLFYEEIQQININSFPFSSAVQIELAKENLNYAKKTLHQLVTQQFLGNNCQFEPLIAGLQQFILVQQLLHESIGDNLFVKQFSNYFQHIEHLTHILKFAPPPIKKLQLALLTEILGKLDIHNHEAQIRHLSNESIQTIIQQSLQYSAQEFNYQDLVHRCIFELIQRATQDIQDQQGLEHYQNWISTLLQMLKHCFKQANLGSQCILDGIEQFEHNGIKIVDLLMQAEAKFRVNLSLNQALSESLLKTLQIKRQLFEQLRFGQDRRYDYFQKICRNVLSDFLSVSKSLKERYLSDNHLSDETFINLSRRAHLQQLHEVITQQNLETFTPPLLVSEHLGIKVYNVGQLKTNLPLKDFPFPSQERKKIKEFIANIQDSGPEQQRKELKKYLEKAQVIAFTTSGERVPEIKFAVRLNYANTTLLNFCLREKRFPSEEEGIHNPNLTLQCLTIRDTKNLDETVIQHAIRTREVTRIKDLNGQRTNLQEKIQHIKRAKQHQEQVQYRLMPLEKNIEQLNTEKQRIEQFIQKQEAIQKLKIKSLEFSQNQVTLTHLYFDLKARQELIEVSIESLQQKLQRLNSHEQRHKQFGGHYSNEAELNYFQLKRKEQLEQLELNKLIQSIQRLQPFVQAHHLSTIPQESCNSIEQLEELCSRLINNQQLLHQEVERLNTFIASIAEYSIHQPYLQLQAIEQQLATQQSLYHEMMSELPNACYQDFSQLAALEANFQSLSEQVIDKRSMFAAFKENFPALKISDLSLSLTQESQFRRLLELFSVYQEARLVLPTIILDFFEQLQQTKLSDIEFPEQSQLLDSQLDKAFKTIQEIQIDSEVSANLEFSIRCQQAIAREQAFNEKIPHLQQELDALLHLATPQAKEQSKQNILSLFKQAYEPSILRQLDIEVLSNHKLDDDINDMIDNLMRIADAVSLGKTFISGSEEQLYLETILNIATRYQQEQHNHPNQHLPDFHALSFKVKHSQRRQTICFFDESHQSVISLGIQLEQALPYSLRKFPKGSYLISYGGSRGIIYYSPQHQKRLMTNLRLIGHGQYASVYQTSDLFSLSELAFKQVVTSPSNTEVFDPFMQTQVTLRPIYARPDNLNQSEEITNRSFSQAIGSVAPDFPIIQEIKPSLYIQNSQSKKISGAQNLALGESLADLTIKSRQSLSKDHQAYHNPCLRLNFNLVQSIKQTLSQALAILKTIEQYHHLGFVHNDIKPENIMLYKKPNGRYEVSLIDKATSAFQRRYQGQQQDLLGVFKEQFPGIMVNAIQDGLVESKEGYYVIQQHQQLFFGKKALLQITFGSRNCTLAYIAPCVIADPTSKETTIITYDNTAMDDWATTVMLFGICQKKAYFELVEGRNAHDYQVPDIIKVVGSKAEELSLDIESFPLFHQYFHCPAPEGSGEVMFVPSNAREGEPVHLYRYLLKMLEELNTFPPTQAIEKTQKALKHILLSVYHAINEGRGLSKANLNQLLLQIETCLSHYEKIVQSQVIDEPIDYQKQFEKALAIARSSELNPLRVAIDEHHCVLDILCLYAQTAEQIQLTRQILDEHRCVLMNMLIGPHAISHQLLQQCVAAHQENIVLAIIEKIKNKANFPELLEKTQLLRQAAQENLTHVCLAIDTVPMTNSFATPYLKWHKSALEFAIDNHNPIIFDSLLKLEKKPLHDALRRCALNDNPLFFAKLFKLLPITTQDLLDHHPISAYHLWICSSKHWAIILEMSDESLTRFLTSSENPALLACQFRNLAAILKLIQSKPHVLNHQQWQKLLCSRDLNNHSILYHALTQGEQEQDVVELFVHLQGHFGEQHMIEFLLQEPMPLRHNQDHVKRLLGLTKNMPLQQMAIILSIKDWLLKQRQIAQDILENPNYLSPQTRLESLMLLTSLEDHQTSFFKTIGQKYLPKAHPSNASLVGLFEYHCLFHPKLNSFLTPDLITLLTQAQQAYQLKQCQMILPAVLSKLDAEDKALFGYMNQLVQTFQLTQTPNATQCFMIDPITLDKLSTFCQTYASSSHPKRLIQDFLDIFDIDQLKKQIRQHNAKDLTQLTQQFGPILKLLLQSELSADDKLMILNQMQALKLQLQDYLNQIQQAIELQKKEQFKLGLTQICEAISLKVHDLKQRHHLKAAERLQMLYQSLVQETQVPIDEHLVYRCRGYFQSALGDQELNAHRHWLLAWIYQFLGLRKPTKTIELIHEQADKLNYFSQYIC